MVANFCKGKSQAGRPIRGRDGRNSVVQVLSNVGFPSNELFEKRSESEEEGSLDLAVFVTSSPRVTDSHDFAVIDDSPYFSSLRADPRFQQLTQRYRK
jgi:hypothetical protein